MKRLLLLATAALLITAETLREQAGRLFTEQKYAAAAAALEEQLRTNSNDYQAILLLALCRQQLREYGKAETLLLRAAMINPKAREPRYSLARLRFMMGRFEDALGDAEQALQLGEPPSRVYHLRARIEEERGNLAVALQEYRRSLSADPKRSEVWSGEASVLYKLGRYSDAQASAESALKLDKSNDEALGLIGRVARAESLAQPDTAQSVQFSLSDSIDFRLQHSPKPEKYLVSTMAGGLAVFDFDNDGLPDVFFTNGAELPSMRKSRPQFWNRLYRNVGNWRFQDVTEVQGLQGEGFSIGAAAGDFDNDGRTDLFISGAGTNLLYRNTPSGFRNLTRTAGIRNEVWSVAAAWVDFDRDGWLDLFVVNYLDWKPEPDRYCGDRSAGLRVYCHPKEYRGLPNRLYRNRHDGTFEDVSERSGIAQHVGKGMSAAVLDADGDGWPDLFVTNDSEPNFLFINERNGSFRESALEFGIALNETGNAISSMGVDARDYDNDGFPDLIVTALTGENFPLFRNTGKRQFRDITFASRLGLTAARRSGWGAVFADFNNDGWKDLFTANGHVTDNVEQFRSERYREPNTVFLNRKGVFGQVEEIGPAAPHRGLAVADLDNDGRMDAIVTVLGAKPEVWRNTTPTGHWIRIRLEGRSIGARVRVGSQWQERTSSSGYASSSLDAIHFGLGQETIARDIEVIWPSGVKQMVGNQNAGQTLVVREPAPQ